MSGAPVRPNATGQLMEGHWGDPGIDLVPVVPSDTVDLTQAARMIRCKPATGAAGTVRLTTANGQIRNTSIALGETLAVSATRVHATGTTATGLEAII